MLDWPLPHLQIQSECHEELCEALFGLLHRGFPKQDIVTQTVAFEFRTALTSVCADFTSHVGRRWICPTPFGTQRLLR